MKRAGLAGALASVLAMAALVQSCASVIGVDDTSDAVAAMCQCNEQLGFLGVSCASRVGSRVDGASEETRSKWLQFFAEHACDECANVTDCYYQPPACAVNRCESSEECCGYEDGSGYCHFGQCYRKAKGCKQTFEKCGAVSECCGSEADLALCQPFLGLEPRCVEQCAQGNVNCPDCCGDYILEDGQPLTFCSKPLEAALPGLFDCSRLCDSNPIEACPIDGQQCSTDCNSVTPSCVYVCQ